jgi:hypothetical protein
MGIKFGSGVTAVGVRGAGFEGWAENFWVRGWARLAEFAQGVHRLRTVARSQFSVLSGFGVNCGGAMA